MSYYFELEKEYAELCAACVEVVERYRAGESEPYSINQFNIPSDLCDAIETLERALSEPEVPVGQHPFERSGAKMKLSEAIAALEGNPRLKIRNGLKEMKSSEGGYLYFNYYDLDGNSKLSFREGSGMVNANLKLSKEGWELVNRPVPVWEAIQALWEGRTDVITCCGRNSAGDEVKTRHSSADGGLIGLIPEVLKGTWYIGEV